MSKLLTFLLKSKLVVKCGNNEYCRMKDYPSLPLLEEQGGEEVRMKRKSLQNHFIHLGVYIIVERTDFGEVASYITT